MTMIYLFIKEGKIVGHLPVDNDFPIKIARKVRDTTYPGARIAVILDGETYP